MPLHCPKENQKEKRSKINIKSKKLNKRKEKLLVSKVFHNKSRWYGLELDVLKGYWTQGLKYWNLAILSGINISKILSSP